MIQHLREISDALVEGNTMGVKNLTEEALRRYIPAESIVNDALIPAMKTVGERFKRGDMLIPDVLMASRAMHAALYVLKPVLSRKKAYRAGRVVIGTVAGDLHDIGKKLVVMLMQSKGLEVVDLGIDIPSDRFVQAVRQHRPDILAMSALLTTTMPAMKKSIDALKAAELRDDVLVLVGGGPVFQEFADEIGADGFAHDAASAAEKAVALVESRQAAAQVTTVMTGTGR